MQRHDVAVLYDDIFLEHFRPGHPESPRRLESIRAALEQERLSGDLRWTSFEPATPEQITAVHSMELYEHVRAISAKGGGAFDADTYLNEHSFEAALHAAGAATRAVEVVLDQDTPARRAFAFVRPPGHHATPSRAMGFCLFNNVAIAARYAVRHYGLRRIFIVDWDVHHGNGTQDIFYEDPHVFFFSIHQQPLYPGTGHLHETGSGNGAGTIANVPMPAGMVDDVYMRVWDEVLLPLLRRWEPQLVLLSAGYDAHWRDPLSDMRLSVAGYGELAARLLEVTDEYEAPLVVLLEGGYDLEAVSYGVVATIQAMRGDTLPRDPLGPPPHVRPGPDVTPILQQIREIHGVRRGT